MANVDYLAVLLRQAEDSLVEADAFEAAGNLSRARSCARVAGDWYVSVAKQWMGADLDHARRYLVLAETAYRRGLTPKRVHQTRCQIEEVDRELQERDARQAEFLAKLEAH